LDGRDIMALAGLQEIREPAWEIRTGG
jgi:hypothetical protein